MRSMAILGNHAFVAQNSCLGVYDFSAALALCSETPQESVPELLRISVQPNPFNTSTAIVLKLPRQSYAQSSIYNIKGQKVYQITERSLPSGVNTLYWDGRSENGKVLPNGIYLLRVSVKGKHFVSRLTLLK